jgi:pSer/pThr/pTyr-binding forkhead associated (FHA) protein
MEYTLEQNTVTIGRSAECDVCISDDLASRRHVQLSIVPDPVQPARSFVHVQDLQSRNGIRINGATIGSTLLDGGRRSSSAAPCSVSIAATTSTSRTSPACAPSA